MRLLTAISLALIVLMALACTATPAPTAEPTVTPAPTPDVPLLDEEMVVDLTIRFLFNVEKHGFPCFDSYLDDDSFFKARYVGKDIWLIEAAEKDRSQISHRVCTFAFHDKEAHVIVPQQEQGISAD